MAQATIDRLIINSPYAEPSQHWQYDPATRLFSLVGGRREAGYIVATPGARERDDPGQFVGIPLVNQIRPRVSAWRAAGYPGATAITSRLLAHWTDPEEYAQRRFFFCQLEAIETLIWLTEAPAAERVGIDVPGDGGAFSRLCCKMATGSGKTHVMAMAIAWHNLNKVAYAQDTRFAKNVLVLTPGLTVKQQNERRLTISHPDNYYQAWRIVPSEMMAPLRQGLVLVRNWQALGWESAEQLARKRGVDKRGPKSNEAYTRAVLGEMARARNLLVINDEAHHAWRVNPEAAGKYLRQRDLRDSAEQATVWVGGLDRRHAARGLLTCYDFSATPFAPSGQRSTDEMLFGWIVSDFGLTDAIESGLVKTPRVVVRDDALPNAATYKSRLYHIYRDPDVQDDLNRRAQEHDPLPDLVTNAYYLLGYDWREAQRAWQKAGLSTPPVMITVCNRTETAARVRYAFEHGRVHIAELCDPARLLHIDSKVLAEAEAQIEPVAAVASTPGDAGEEEASEGQAAPGPKLTKRRQAENLRLTVGTVGRVGQPGEQVH
ncbi:MAG: DEAD/DEAH box helicase family protein, partial [Chloroflexota bacterium]